MQPSSWVHCPCPCGAGCSLRSLLTQTILWFYERLQAVPTRVKLGLWCVRGTFTHYLKLPKQAECFYKSEIHCLAYGHHITPFWFELMFLSYFSRKRCHCAGGSLFTLCLVLSMKSLWRGVTVRACTWTFAHTHVRGCVHLSGAAEQALLFTHCPAPAFLRDGYWLTAVFKTFLFPTYWICAVFIYLLFHLCLFRFTPPRVFLIGVSCSQLLCVKRLRT